MTCETYKGVSVKQTMMTAIECISADGRSLPLIIWPSQGSEEYNSGQLNKEN